MTDDELREELESHITMLAEQYQRQGITEAQAMEAARRQFGNRTRIQEETRSVHINQFLETLVQDVRYALRGFVHNPAFALTAIFAAALGIGPTTAVFSIVDRLLFRPLPYSGADRLVSVGMMAPLDSNEFMFASEYNDLRRDPGPFTGVTAFEAGAFDCDLTEQSPLRMRCVRAEADFLPTLGMAPFIGRTFNEQENRPGGPAAVLISYGLWLSRFAGDPAAVGGTLALDGAAPTIVGVLPKNFEIPTLTPADVLLPLAIASTERNGRAFRVFARMKPGITSRQAWEQLQPHFQRSMLEVPLPFRKEVSFRVQPVRDRQIGDARLTSLTLFGSVLAVLLIACANIATILLARSVSRQREVAMRLALGASRWRLARQTLTECLLLALAGGIAGVALAWALVRACVAMAPGSLPRMDQAAIDGRVLVFALAASLGAGVVFGILPALRRPAPYWISGWRSSGRIAGGLRTLLVTAQIALSIVLLTGAGLLLRSLWNLQRVPLGIDTENVLTAKFALGKHRFPNATSQLAAFSQLEQSLAAIPGVEAAAISDSLPPMGGMRARPLRALLVEGKAQRPEGTGGMIAWRYVTPGYFAAFHIPVVRGRGFTGVDRDPGVRSVILSESLARLLFPGEDPLGRHILRDDRNEWFTVIGIATDALNSGLNRDAGPEYYLVRKSMPDPTWNQQEPPMGWRGASAIVRTSISPKLVAGAVREALAGLDPAMPVDVQSMRQRVDGITQRPRFNAILLALFAAIGVVLAAVGLYGVVAFLVSQSTQEIGIRLALGATPSRITALVLGLAARWTIAGAILGTIAALYSTKVLRTMLFGVPERDPFTIGAVVLLLLVVAMLAAWLPSRRAARVDPIAALRHD